MAGACDDITRFVHVTLMNLEMTIVCSLSFDVAYCIYNIYVCPDKLFLAEYSNQSQHVVINADIVSHALLP